jgi:hypothetical protein
MMSMLSSASLFSMASAGTLPSVRSSMAPSGKRKSALAVAGIPQASRVRGMPLSETVGRGGKTGAMLAGATGKAVTKTGTSGIVAHPGPSAGRGRGKSKKRLLSGLAARQFVRKFRKLPPPRQSRWFVRAKAQLEQLWEEAAVVDRDRSFFRRAHCYGAFTISKAVAVAMHLQLLTVHCKSKAFVVSLILQRERCIAATKDEIREFHVVWEKRQVRLASSARAVATAPHLQFVFPLQRYYKTLERPIIGRDEEFEVVRKEQRIRLRALLLSLVSEGRRIINS